MISTPIVLLDAAGTVAASRTRPGDPLRAFDAQQAATTHDVPAAQSGGAVRDALRRQDQHRGQGLQARPEDVHEQAQAVSASLMDVSGERAHPGERWEMAPGKATPPNSPNPRACRTPSQPQRPVAAGAGRAVEKPAPGHSSRATPTRAFSARLQSLESRDCTSLSRKASAFFTTTSARQHDRSELRHVPSRRRQHASGDLSQVSSPTSAGSACCAT